ncbi:MAG: hypothetical protein V4685_05870, partial [Bacteroidota bacterium]
LHVTYQQIPERVKEKEELIIITNDSKNSDYRIELNTIATHFDEETAERGVDTTISLSKSKDKYLLLPLTGGTTAVTIYNDKDKNIILDEKLLPKVNLSDFKAGNYRIHYTSCDFNFQLSMEITD